jgi:uncharacterized protein (TIGR03435 family)
MMSDFGCFASIEVIPFNSYGGGCLDVMTRIAVSRSVLAAVVGCSAFAGPVMGQEMAKTPEYDAVSIKPHQAEGDRMMMRMQTSGDRYSSSGASVKGLIQYAYNLKSEDQISGAGAVGDKRFDVEAKIDADTVAALAEMPLAESDAVRRKMMQGMLADRFKLKVHHENKELPIYALVVAKGGPKLKEADPNAPMPNAPNGMKMPEGGPNGIGMKMPEGAPHGNGMMMMTPGSITARGIPIANLVNILTMQLHRQVVDKTGLTGKYDIDLKFGPEDGKAMMQGDPSAPGPVTADSGPSIFTALEEELGVKLESTKGPVDTIVVEHLEMPSEN